MNGSPPQRHPPAMHIRLALRLLSVAAVVMVAACGAPGGETEKQARDVSGNYALTYTDDVKLTLNVGGAIREVTHSGFGGVVDFGVVEGQPVTLDLGAFCARPDVDCPSEAFWPKVAVDQPDLSSAGDLQRLVVVNDTVHALDAGVRAASLTGLVDHAQQDRFLLGLGVNGAAAQSCAALAISLAGGRFTRAGEHVETVLVWRTSKGKACDADAGLPDAGPGDGGVPAGLLADGGLDCTEVETQRLVVPPGAKVTGIAEGKVGLGWLGGCAFGPVLVGATLTAETSFTGVRTGDFDPPPYTPAPVVMPDGGFDDAPDGGP